MRDGCDVTADEELKAYYASPHYLRWKEYMDAGRDRSPLGLERRHFHYMIESILNIFDNRLKSDGETLGKHADALANARKEFPAHLEALENALIGLSDEDRKKTAAQKIDDLHQVIFDLSFICSLVTWPEIAAIDGKRLQAKMSRAAKAAKHKPRTEAINAAIITLRGDQVSHHPTTEAKRILDRVNEALERAEVAPVKIDVIRRHLERFSRS